MLSLRHYVKEQMAAHGGNALIEEYALSRLWSRLVRDLLALLEPHLGAITCRVILCALLISTYLRR